MSVLTTEQDGIPNEQLHVHSAECGYSCAQSQVGPKQALVAKPTDEQETLVQHNYGCLEHRMKMVTN
jgi:hypothetical protein